MAPATRIRTSITIEGKQKLKDKRKEMHGKMLKSKTGQKLMKNKYAAKILSPPENPELSLSEAHRFHSEMTLPRHKPDPRTGHRRKCEPGEKGGELYPLWGTTVRAPRRSPPPPAPCFPALHRPP